MHPHFTPSPIEIARRWRPPWEVIVGVLVAVWGASSVTAENVVSTFNGPAGNRVDVVFVGDGYQEHELDLFHQHVDGAVDYMFLGREEPFQRYQQFFNFHRVEVISQESGADIPPEDIYVDTALGAKYFWDGVTERLLSVNQVAADTIVNRWLPRGIDVDMRFATVNSEKYGGAGGVYATFAGGNAAAYEVALHEVAHSFSNLADEYVSFSTPYTRGEPEEVNVTTDPLGAKWERWLGYVQNGIGAIGVYEGGRYYPTDIYRPSEDSKMRTLGRPFDAVAREQIILDIYTHVTPLDDYLPTDVTLRFADDAWVQAVDPTVITTRWYLDDEPLGHTGNELSLLDWLSLDIKPGEHTLTAEAVDETDWIRWEEKRPRESVSWFVEYYPGDFNADQIVNGLDIDLLSSAILSGQPGTLFDLTQDAQVDQADRDLWVAANHFLYGDLDFNGAVDFADFLVLSSNFGTAADRWADGNLDGAWGVEFEDFLILSANFGQTSSLAMAVVPEPLGTAWLSVAAFLLSGRRKRRVCGWR